MKPELNRTQAIYPPEGPKPKVCVTTTNLSETLQKAGMSATSGQHNAKLTKDALKKIRTDDCFATFYQTVFRKKQLHVSITEPEVPRNKRAPGRFEVGTGTPFFPVTPEQVHRRIYFEALDQ